VARRYWSPLGTASGSWASAEKYSREPSARTPRSRPQVAQIDTVRLSSCQDRHRSSRLRGARPESDRLRLGLHPPRRFRLPEVPRPDVRLQGLIGVAGLPDHVLGGLRAEPPVLQVTADCLRSAYSRNTRRSKATADTRFAASLTARRVASSADAWPAAWRTRRRVCRSP